jgi:hypothetical protein
VQSAGRITVSLHSNCVLERAKNSLSLTRVRGSIRIFRVTPQQVSSPSLSVLCGHPRPCSAMPGTATTTPALLSMRGRDAAMHAAVTRTDHRQRLPRARTKTPGPTTTPPPSKPPLFKYGTRRDDKTGARTAGTTANSPALYAIPPHVAKQCGMPVNHPLLGL